MANTSVGRQIVSMTYGAQAKSANLNQINYGLIPPGIYQGGELEKDPDSNERVFIHPFTLYIHDPSVSTGESAQTVGTESGNEEHEIDGIGIRIQTQATATVGTSTNPITSSSPFICAEYVWTEATGVYLDFFHASYNQITNPDNSHWIIFGRAIFDSTDTSIMLEEFDYTSKTEPSIAIIERQKDSLKVVPAADEGVGNSVVRVYPGTFLHNNILYVFDGNEGGLPGKLSGANAIPATEDNGRYDLVFINVDTMEVSIRQGESIANPVAPAYPLNGLVVAEIHRGPNRTNVTGADIVLIKNLDAISLTDLPWDSADGSPNASVIPYGADTYTVQTPEEDELTIEREDNLPTVISKIVNFFKDKGMRLVGDQTVSDTKTFTGAARMTSDPSNDNDLTRKSYVDANTTDKVPQSRTISTDSGLSGGGDLSANRTLSVDSTVVRTSGNQTIGGNKIYSDSATFDSFLYPRSFPNLGSFSLAPESSHEPARGLYNASVRTNRGLIVSGGLQSGDGPYAGNSSNRVSNNSNSTSITWYYARF